MKHWKITLIILALITLSSLLGYRIGFDTHRKAVTRAVSAEDWDRAAMRGLTEKLKLSQDQRDLAQAAIDRALLKLKGTRQQALAETSEIIKELLADVETGLTPEQKEKFAALKPKANQITLDLLRVEPRRK